MTIDHDAFALMQETIAALTFRQIAQEVALTVMAHNVATLGRADLEVMACQLEASICQGDFNSEVKCCIQDLARSIRQMHVERVELLPCV